MEDKVHRAFRSRGETWVWDAEIGFVRVLTMKHREAGAKGWWAGECLSWALAASLFGGPRKEREASQKDLCWEGIGVG